MYASAQPLDFLARTKKSSFPNWKLIFSHPVSGWKLSESEEFMKEIKAIIRPSKLLEVTEELHEIQGLPGVTVSEIKGFGKGRAKNATDKIVYEMVELIPRIQLEVVVNDEMVNEVVNVIQKYAHTGNTGDGKIFVVNVEEIVKIRTNERGKDAI
jgi:nitrogen regulatory protein P-II 1